MTNGEKIQTILDIDKDCTEVYGKNGMMTFSVPQEWWNAEYKEPTTKSDCAERDGCIHKCIDKPTEDCISREQAIEWVDNLRKMDECFGNHKGDYYPLSEVIDRLQNVPSVTPLLSSELEKNSKKLEKDFGELDCISRADAIKAMQDKTKKLTNEDTINGLCGAVAILFDLPSVTPEKPEIVPIAEIKYDEDKLKELLSKCVLTVTPQEPRWIPVSERLPEDIKPVIVTWKNTDPKSYYQYIVGKHFIGTAHYKSDKWYWYSSVTEDLLAEYGKCDSEEFDEAIEVVAWMPLPAPYEPQESEDEE